MMNVKYITLGDTDFIITHEFDLNGNHYMLAIDEDKEERMVVLRQKFVDGVEKVESVKDEEEIKMIFDYVKRENGLS